MTTLTFPKLFCEANSKGRMALHLFFRSLISNFDFLAGGGGTGSFLFVLWERGVIKELLSFFLGVWGGSIYRSEPLEMREGRARRNETNKKDAICSNFGFLRALRVALGFLEEQWEIKCFVRAEGLF